MTVLSHPTALRPTGATLNEASLANTLVIEAINGTVDGLTSAITGALRLAGRANGIGVELFDLAQAQVDRVLELADDLDLSSVLLEAVGEPVRWPQGEDALQRIATALLCDDFAAVEVHVLHDPDVELFALCSVIVALLAFEARVEAYVRDVYPEGTEDLLPAGVTWLDVHDDGQAVLIALLNGLEEDDAAGIRALLAAGEVFDSMMIETLVELRGEGDEIRCQPSLLSALAS